MCSYNRVNGTWACEDAQSLNEIKAIQGFAGWMMSDVSADPACAFSLSLFLSHHSPAPFYYETAVGRHPLHCGLRQ